MSHFELIIYWLMAVPRLPVLILFSFLGLVAGLFVAAKPGLSIQIQQRFYARINWRMEPISMEKELYNTRFLGLFLIAISLMALFLAVNKLILL